VVAADLPALTHAVEHSGLPRPEASDLLAITSELRNVEILDMDVAARPASRSAGSTSRRRC
jgi:hypothetical protein